MHTDLFGANLISAFSTDSASNPQIDRLVLLCLSAMPLVCLVYIYGIIHAYRMIDLYVYLLIVRRMLVLGSVFGTKKNSFCGICLPCHARRAATLLCFRLHPCN